MTDAMAPANGCPVCGSPVRPDNKYGICTRTVACLNARAEVSRRLRGIQPKRRGRRKCQVEGCPFFVRVRGLCEVHDRRRRKTGDPGTSGPRPWGVVIEIKAGAVFGKLTVTDDFHGSGRYTVQCRCECGRERAVRGYHLVSGRTQSCGCSRRKPHPRNLPYMASGAAYGQLTALEDAWRASDRIAFRCSCGSESSRTAVSVRSGGVMSCGCLLRQLTHGLSRHPLYHVWSGIIDRTTNPARTGYASYGGRGISMSPRWMDLTVFVADIECEIGPRPESHTLDRINNDGNYEPGNVRWASATQQARNRRTVAALTAERDALQALLDSLQGGTGRSF